MKDKLLKEHIKNRDRLLFYLEKSLELEKPAGIVDRYSLPRHKRPRNNKS